MAINRYICTLAALVMAISAVGCSSSSSDVKPEKGKKKSGEENPDVPELNYSFSVDTPEPDLLATAKKLYSSELYSEAKAAFEALRDGYPFGPYAELAYLKIADCDFEMHNYGSASKEYEEFLKEYPAHTSADYATIRAARSAQISVRDIGRDPTPLKKALELYDRFLKDYPDSIFRSSAESFRQETINEMIAYDAFVMDFYQKRGNEKAYEARRTALEQNWGEYPAARRVLGEESSVEPVTVVSASWGEPAVSSISERTLIAKVESKKAAMKTAPSLPDQSANGITQIQCQDNMMFVYLRDELPLNSFDDNSKLLPSGSVLELNIPGLTAKAETKDCFGSDDLKVGQDGSLSLKTDREAQLFRLSNPPRLVLAFP